MLPRSGSEKWAIIVFGYDRPAMLHRCAQHLHLALSLLDIPYRVYLHLDKPPSSQIEQSCIEEFARGLGGLPFSLDIEPSHVGVWSIPQFTMRVLSQDTSFTHVFILEDDVLLAGNALQFAKRCSDWCSKQGLTPGYISCWSICFLPTGEKQAAADRLKISTENIFASLWQAPVYKLAHQLLEPAYSIIQNYGIDTLPANESIRAYRWDLFYRRKSLQSPVPARAYKAHLAEFFRSQNLSASQDGLFQTAILHLGYTPIVPVVNRCINIGKEGIHCNEALWKSWGWDKITLDDLEEPVEYRWDD